MTADMLLILLFFGIGRRTCAGVPGDSLSTEGFNPSSFYDHIIDLGLQQLKTNNQGNSIEASVKKLEPNSSEIAVEGTIKFDVMNAIRSKRSRSKLLQNGDLDLLGSIEFGNLSGTGNFSALNSKEESKQYFALSGNPTRMNVFFMLTKDPSQKRVAFQFDKIFYYNIKDPHINLNATLLLEPNASAVLNRLFNDLYNIIYERIILTPRTDSTYFEGVLDKVLKKLSGETVGGIGSSSSMKSDTYWYKSGKKLRANVLHSLTRMSKVTAIKEINGDHDLQTTLKFGNVSGIELFYNHTSNITVDESCTFISPPVVVEAHLYVPRNKSFIAESLTFLIHPNYTIQPKNEKLRISFWRFLENYEWSMYSKATIRIIEEIQKEIFPNTSVTNNN